jgi:hypothetical protein
VSGCGSVTDAEDLLDVADAMLRPGLLVAERPMESYELAVAALALALRRAPALLKFRAIAEGWDRQTIVKEMY